MEDGCTRVMQVHDKKRIVSSFLIWNNCNKRVSINLTSSKTDSFQLRQTIVHRKCKPDSGVI